jgi:gamma-D-glutamyl-L-lysine dipeptidyl-peptidase
MRYALCTVPAAPVRKEDAHRSEMVNQLLFGEAMEILEVKEEWFRIRSLYDDYEGWLTYHLVTEVEERIAKTNAEWVVGNLVNMAKYREQFMNLPMGSPLIGYDPSSTTLWDEDYKFLGHAQHIEGNATPSGITEVARLWLNAPYLWGGKTLMGVDCSGFVQTVYRYNGIPLKRDAWQQAEQGEVIELQDTRRSDLAFFHNEKGRIVHVGIILENNQIIHAAGKVRIDQLDSGGIVNSDTGKRTHQLHATRRYF